MQAKLGDKVRVKVDKARGIVERVDSSGLGVRLDNGKFVQLIDSQVTNYSLAARKAWESMPNRRVGRPKGSSRTDRVSVTLRIDREIWDKFKDAEARGIVNDRTATINGLIAKKLRELDY